MSSKLVSTGIEFPDSSTQTTAATAGAADFSALTDATVSTTDPATDTNPSATGHHWINKTSGEYFVCTDNTTDENVWTNIGEGVDGVEPNYFVGGSRGVFPGGEGSIGRTDTIDYITITTLGNATDFGNLTTSWSDGSSCSNGTRGFTCAGYAASSTNRIEYITIATTGNATDFGDMTFSGAGGSAVASKTRAVVTRGGEYYNTIDYFSVDTLGNSQDFGDLTVARKQSASAGTTVRGVFAGGQISGGTSDTIDYVTLDTLGNAADFGNLSAINRGVFACCDGLRAVFGGGQNDPNKTTLEYITVATLGNTTDFGDLIVEYAGVEGCSDEVKGVFGAEYSAAGIDYITIQTLGNSTSFGNLTVARRSQAFSGN